MKTKVNCCWPVQVEQIQPYGELCTFSFIFVPDWEGKWFKDKFWQIPASPVSVRHASELTVYKQVESNCQNWG